MSGKWERFMAWNERQLEISTRLSSKDAWTPELKHVARLFLIVGFILGIAEGCWIMYVILRYTQ